jgi:hypothetical protein
MYHLTIKKIAKPCIYKERLLTEQSCTPLRGRDYQSSHLPERRNHGITLPISAFERNKRLHAQIAHVGHTFFFLFVFFFLFLRVKKQAVLGHSRDNPFPAVISENNRREGSL